jgi:hypothetical protein
VERAWVSDACSIEKEKKNCICKHSLRFVLVDERDKGSYKFGF